MVGSFCHQVVADYALQSRLSFRFASATFFISSYISESFSMAVIMPAELGIESNSCNSRG